MSLSLNLNLFIYFMMYLCISLTMMYSSRLMYYLVFNLNMFNSLNSKYDFFNTNMSMLLLFFMSIIFGSMINWMLFSSLMLFPINFDIKANLYMMMMLSMSIMLI